MNFMPNGKSGAVSASRIKLYLMVALLSVGLLLWGRLLLKQVPRTAVADDVAAVGADASGSTVSGVRASEHAPVVKIARADLSTSLARDPFELDDSGYQKVAKVEPPVAPVIDAKKVEAEKSVDKSADEARRVESIRRAADAFSLKSTVTGDRPRAVIDGVTVAPGQKFRGFTLIRVEARCVVLEKEGVEVLLEM